MGLINPPPRPASCMTVAAPPTSNRLDIMEERDNCCVRLALRILKNIQGGVTAPSKSFQVAIYAPRARKWSDAFAVAFSN